MVGKMGDKIISVSFAFLIILSFLGCNATFVNVYPKYKGHPVRGEGNAGGRLYLTPLIENGKILEARKKATVLHEGMNEISSYAGFLTVNKKYNSNLFFWFFPAQINPKYAPVVLWLQGGPGATSMFGLFYENGPFIVTKNMTLTMRKYSWNTGHNLIYIDNPVGTGYSFTENEKGYVRNETHVGRDLYAALVQFFQLFPELQKNDFFVTGESYAGKYVPAVSHAIKDYNMKAKNKINLKGLAIGNGMTDPENQLMYGDYLYQIGLIDAHGQKQFHEYEKKGRKLIQENKFEEACDVFDRLLNNDFSKQPSLLNNLTGYSAYYNYINPNQTFDNQLMTEWIQQPEVRHAIHVGNTSFTPQNDKVEMYLKNDIMQSVAALVADLLDHYKVLIYNGQLDIIVAYPLTENYLQNLKWSGMDKYKNAIRKKWMVGKSLAGYTKTVDNLTEVLVRNAGHMVPADQPQWGLDLITRFTHGKMF